MSYKIPGYLTTAPEGARVELTEALVVAGFKLVAPDKDSPIFSTVPAGTGGTVIERVVGDYFVVRFDVPVPALRDTCNEWAFPDGVTAPMVKRPPSPS